MQCDDTIHLKKLTADGDRAVYDMLQQIGANENEFKNEVAGMTYEQFCDWLVVQDAWSRGEDLPDGYVAQTVFWLYDDDTPVGYGKVRHNLTEASRKIGGNLGYAIAGPYRGRGYGKALMSMLVQEAKDMGIGELLATVENGNVASMKAIVAAGGRLISTTPERNYYTFD